MVEEGDEVIVELRGKVIEIFDDDDYPPGEEGVDVSIHNQHELSLGGLNVFVDEDQLEVVDDDEK